jgi:hypothetical protein
MNNTDFLQKAINKVTEASQLEKDGKFGDAFQRYLISFEYFIAFLKCSSTVLFFLIFERFKK